ncbi:MAG: hypothetical protein QW057_01065 [Candidatus Bathyarchaeia archaeon]
MKKAYAETRGELRAYKRISPVKPSTAGLTIGLSMGKVKKARGTSRPQET